MKRLHRLIVEAHRRSLWQVLSIYLAASYGAIQLVDLVTNYMGLPDWVPGFALVLIVIGLPIVLATAFVQEGVPGLRGPVAAPTDAGTLSASETQAAPGTPTDSGAPANSRAAPAPAAAVVPVVPTRRHRLFTWKKAALGGVGALLLLSVTAGGYMGMRTTGIGPFGSLVASGAVDAREPILIAEFESLSGDTLLGMAVTEAFRVDFAQTSVVTVFSPAQAGSVLRLMGRDPRTRIDEELAHEVALRANLGAYLTGELSELGGRFVVTGKLLSTRDQRVLATYRETARDSSEILDAIDRLSNKLRERLGESLKATRVEKPLAAVSTPSLEALQKYTEGMYLVDRARNFEQGIALLQQALELDSMFAMAWRKLAVAHTNNGAPQDMIVQAARRAYELRDRLTENERYETSGYYFYKAGDYRRAIREWELLAARDPSWPAINLGLAYSFVRETDKAERVLRGVLARDSMVHTATYNLAAMLWELGRDEEAVAVVESLDARMGHVSAAPLLQRANLAVYSWNFDAAAAFLDQAVTREPGSSLVRSVTASYRSLAFQVQGRLASARQAEAEYIALEQELRPTLAQLEVKLGRAYLLLFTHRDPARAVAELDAALRDHRLDAIPALDRPYVDLARVYALGGQEARARALWAEYNRDVPAALRFNTARDEARLEGAIAFGSRQYDQALAHWRRAGTLGTPCVLCMDSEMALAFQAAQQPDSAIARYVHYIDTRFIGRSVTDGSELAPAHERLAELYDAKGDLENAARHAARFVELWSHADQELQPRVAAKRQMLQRVTAEGRARSGSSP